LLALRQIEQTGILHQYAQLVEVGKGKVAQAEHTVLLTSKEKIITTRD
jgi:methionine aminopeptidase